MTLLNREQLLKKQELKKEKVVLNDGTGDFVYVRQMTAREKNNWELLQMQTTVVKNNKGHKVRTNYDVTLDDFRAKLAVNCVCDEKGILLFKQTDFKILSQNMSAETMERIVDVAQKLNAISEEDKEEMTKNS